jgi:hypothetical protein
MSPTPTRDHDSVFKWLWAQKPLDDEEFDWIFHHDDFVSLTPTRQSRFETFIVNHLDGWPNSCFKVKYPSCKLPRQQPLISSFPKRDYFKLANS